MAFDYFDQSDVEVAIIETGLGGRLDATNLITPILSVVTNIAMEHTEFLGDTIEKIASEKAGIIKKSIPVVVGERNDDYDHIFVNRGAELNSRVIFAEEEFHLRLSSTSTTSASTSALSVSAMAVYLSSISTSWVTISATTSSRRVPLPTTLQR